MREKKEEIENEIEEVIPTYPGTYKAFISDEFRGVLINQLNRVAESKGEKKTVEMLETLLYPYFLWNKEYKKRLAKGKDKLKILMLFMCHAGILYKTHISLSGFLRR